MDIRRRLMGITLGVTVLLHGLGHAVLPMRGADVVAPGVLAPAVTALYVLAMLGFVATGLGLLGVRPLSRAVVPMVFTAGVIGLGAQLAYFDAGLWPGIILSVSLPVMTLLFVTLKPGTDARAPRRPWKRVGDVAGLLFLAWVTASATLWPWHRTWGAAPYEWSAALPGDHTPRTPQFEILHAVAIDAPPDAVWPWLVQLGQDRAGFYSYDWLERLFGVDIRNVDEIRPEWQTLRAGDAVHATQEGYLGGLFGNRPGWRVADVDTNSALVLDGWGAFVLVPTPDGGTRFIIRSTISNERIPVWASAVNLVAFELPHFIMQRKMMLTIKALAERDAASRAAGRAPQQAAGASH
jgi:hypothetical protein